MIDESSELLFSREQMQEHLQPYIRRVMKPTEWRREWDSTDENVLIGWMRLVAMAVAGVRIPRIQELMRYSCAPHVPEI